MAYLFYTNYDPKNFQALHPIPNTHLTENIHGVKLENVLVLPPGERSWKDLSPDDLRSTGKIMLIISQSQMPDAGRDILAGYAGFNYLDTIYYPDNTPAFYILNR